jgi:hypothetical protein
MDSEPERRAAGRAAASVSEPAAADPVSVVKKYLMMDLIDNRHKYRVECTAIPNNKRLFHTKS